MNFVWPQNLWLLLALPLLPALYLWLLRRRSRHALRVSTVSLARQAMGRTWRRHVPPALFWLALSVLLLGLARPSARVTLPWSTSTIMLAIDVSLSMRVQDVKPTRMVAAQEAARTFLHELPSNIQVGIVTFAGSAQVAQQATIDRPSLLGAIDAIQMQIGTAVGSAIVLCLRELFPRLRPDGVLFSSDGHLRATHQLLGDERFWRDEIGVSPPHIDGLGDRKLLVVRPRR